MSASRTYSAGSSPLARGARGGREPEVKSHGLIPARAGSTGTVTRAGAASGAHPRSRGEHTDSTSIQTPRSGSSPLARGARGMHF